MNKELRESINLSVDLSKIGGRSRLISNNLSLSSYFEIFEENEIENKLLNRDDLVTRIFSALEECNHVGIVLGKNDIWTIYFNGNVSESDILLAEWFILMKLNDICTVNLEIWNTLTNSVWKQLLIYLEHNSLNDCISDIVERLGGR